MTKQKLIYLLDRHNHGENAMTIRPWCERASAHRRRSMILACLSATIALSASDLRAQTTPGGAREVPAKVIPVPDTVSPQMQKLISAPPRPTWNVIPKTIDEWKAEVNAGATARVARLKPMAEALRVKVDPITIDGAKAFEVKPEEIAPDNKDRLLVHLHGGCFVSFPGESGTGEAILMAGLGRFKVISVDYRMAPDHPHPAALDDVIAVWRAVSTTTAPKNMAIFGSSAGGNLTLAAVLRAKQENLPLPAAIAPATPMSDLTNAGDTLQTNAFLDNVLVAPDGDCDKRAALYIGGRDAKDPLLSPVYGDMHGFPPAILTTGTRDLLLSSTVRIHRKLRQAGVEAALQVFEGQSHAQFLYDFNAPETKEAFEEIAQFFDKHLSR
jgi:epsilon-lactone hydrolase